MAASRLGRIPTGELASWARLRCSRFGSDCISRLLSISICAVHSDKLRYRRRDPMSFIKDVASCGLHNSLSTLHSFVHFENKRMDCIHPLYRRLSSLIRLRLQRLAASCSNSCFKRPTPYSISSSCVKCPILLVSLRKLLSRPRVSMLTLQKSSAWKIGLQLLHTAWHAHESVAVTCSAMIPTTSTGSTANIAAKRERSACVAEQRRDLYLKNFISSPL